MFKLMYDQNFMHINVLRTIVTVSLISSMLLLQYIFLFKERKAYPGASLIFSKEKYPRFNSTKNIVVMATQENKSCVQINGTPHCYYMSKK